MKRENQPPYFQCLIIFQQIILLPFSFNCSFLKYSFGTQQPIALLKLLFEKGGMFGRDKDLNWKKLKDILYFGAMCTPGGGRTELDKRFVSLCATFNITAATDKTVHDIYQSILRGHLANFDAELLPISDKLIKITLKLFKVMLYFSPKL